MRAFQKAYTDILCHAKPWVSIDPRFLPVRQMPQIMELTGAQSTTVPRAKRLLGLVTAREDPPLEQSVRSWMPRDHWRRSGVEIVDPANQLRRFDRLDVQIEHQARLAASRKHTVEL